MAKLCRCDGFDGDLVLGVWFDEHLLFESATALSAEAVASEDEDLGAVGQSVEARRGQEWIAEEVRPLGARDRKGLPAQEAGAA